MNNHQNRNGQWFIEDDIHMLTVTFSSIVVREFDHEMNVIIMFTISRTFWTSYHWDCVVRKIIQDRKRRKNER